ncbi:MAG TPA: hypothetical protein VIS99_02055, partial [Terrimicrobiaceae bacterium]
SIIRQLKDEMAYVAGLWGIGVETVEIKSVRILSRQLFENLQAPFRNAMRLESEQSAIETERRLAEQRTAQQEELAGRNTSSKSAGSSLRSRSCLMRPSSMPSALNCKRRMPGGAWSSARWIRKSSKNGSP